MQLNLFEIDELIEEIRQESIDEAISIADEAEYEAKRQKLLDWIRKEEPVFIIAFSGGKDSVAMFLYLHFELGIPKERIELWHHEVDGHGQQLFDWPCTTSYCQAFAQAFGVDIYFSYREGGIEREIYRQNEGLQDVLYQAVPGGPYLRLESKPGSSTRMKFPAIAADLRTRWCSSVVKIEVMSRAITAQERFKEAKMIICTGERRVESAARSRYDEIELYRNASKTRKALTWRCILDWTDQQVWAIMEKYGVQSHPAYELGFSRCSCQLCIFNGPKMWYLNSLLAPEKIKAIASIEKDIKDENNGYGPRGYGGTLHREYSIEQFVAKGKFALSEKQAEMMKIWGPVAMGTFTAPLIITDWKLPLGALENENCGAS